jgi:hypothetical protein
MWRRTGRPGVAEDVERRAAEAAKLAKIPGQTRLRDPRTNPAVRSHADHLLNVQHRLQLDAEHGRLRRRHRVEDRRAEHAEKALEALQSAREASSAAKSVLALHASRTRYMRVSLATSITLAFGSARGLEQLADRHGIPAGSGYIAEVGLTGLATIVILAKSDLTQHGGKVKAWQSSALWTLMVAPLVASMVANVHGGNAIGAICAAGAAAFAFFSYIIADAFATSARDQAARVTGEDETDLRKIAVGDDLFSTRTNEVREPGVEDDAAAEPVRVEVREPAEVHEPQQVPNRTEEAANPEPRTNGSEPEQANLEPQVHEPLPDEPAEQKADEPVEQEVPNQKPSVDAKPRTKSTANLGDRAKRKATEIQQVVDLIHERGEKAVTLTVVREVLGFTKTTAYHRLVAARELVNQEAVAS